MLEADAESIGTVRLQGGGPLLALPAGVVLGRLVAAKQPRVDRYGTGGLSQGIERAGEVPQRQRAVRHDFQRRREQNEGLIVALLLVEGHAELRENPVTLRVP